MLPAILRVFSAWAYSLPVSYTHLDVYKRQLYDLSGKPIDQLTSGDWGITGTSGFGPGAVGQPAVDEVRGYIYFLSNKDNVRETQLYRLSLRDKSVTRITGEPGTHDVMIAPDESCLLYTSRCV